LFSVICHLILRLYCSSLKLASLSVVIAHSEYVIHQ